MDHPVAIAVEDSQEKQREPSTRELEVTCGNDWSAASTQVEPPLNQPRRRPPIPPPPSLLCRPVLLELPLPPELPRDRCLPSSTPDGLLDRVLDDDGPGEGLLSGDGSPAALSDDSGDSKAPGIRTPLLLSLLRDGNLGLPDCSDSARLLCASLIDSPAFGVMLFRQMGQVSCSDSQAVTH